MSLGLMFQKPKPGPVPRIWILAEVSLPFPESISLITFSGFKTLLHSLVHGLLPPSAKPFPAGQILVTLDHSGIFYLSLQLLRTLLLTGSGIIQDDLY